MLIKFCGLRSARDILIANQLKADFYGIIFHKKSPRYVKPEDASQFPVISAKRVGVFTSHDPEEMLQIKKQANLDYIQLHDSQCPELARIVGAKNVIRTLWPMKFQNMTQFHDEARKYADNCAYYLLDAGKHGGGSGQTLDWRILADLTLPHPWFLAGGLQADNLGEALSSCTPAGVDLNSGIENSQYRKSPEKMREVIKIIRDQESSIPKIYQ